MNFKIISGYTKNTPYEQEIQTLIDSLKKYGITNYEIIPYDNLGTWTKNCQYKSKIILQQLQKCNIPIVWVDADAVLYDYPSLFDNINKDIAFCDYYGGVASGTLYIKPMTNMLELCKEWIDLNAQDTTIWDQRNLTKLIKKYDIAYYKLPVTYCKIDFAKSKEKIIIGQNQASRRFKKLINASSNTNNSNNNNNTVKYSTHLKLLTKYLLQLDNNDTVVETGCGFFSSPVIASIAEYKKLKYYIYYSDELYKNSIAEFIYNANFIKVDDWSNWYPNIEAGLYFHDNEELIINRYKHIDKILPKTKFLILHDYSTYLDRKCDMTKYSIVEEFKELIPSTCAIKGYL